jgi:hypothetical protein
LTLVRWKFWKNRRNVPCDLSHQALLPRFTEHPLPQEMKAAGIAPPGPTKYQATPPFTACLAGFEVAAAGSSSRVNSRIGPDFSKESIRRHAVAAA